MWAWRRRRSAGAISARLLAGHVPARHRARPPRARRIADAAPLVRSAVSERRRAAPWSAPSRTTIASSAPTARGGERRRRRSRGAGRGPAARASLRLAGSPSAPLATTIRGPRARPATARSFTAAGKPAPPRPRRPLRSTASISSRALAAAGRGSGPCRVEVLGQRRIAAGAQAGEQPAGARAGGRRAAIGAPQASELPRAGTRPGHAPLAGRCAAPIAQPHRPCRRRACRGLDPCPCERHDPARVERRLPAGPSVTRPDVIATPPPAERLAESVIVERAPARR